MGDKTNSKTGNNSRDMKKDAAVSSVGQTSGGKGMAITAFVLSIFGIIPVFGLLFILIALILGIISLAKHKAGKGFAISAIIIAVVMVVLQIIGFIVLSFLAVYYTSTVLGGNYVFVDSPFTANSLNINEGNISFEIINNGTESYIVGVDAKLESPKGVSCSSPEKKNIASGSSEIYTLTCQGIKSGDYVLGGLIIGYSNGNDEIKITEGGISGTAA